MAYDPFRDTITAMAQVLKNYQNDFDMIKAAEMHYERMRSLNKTTLIQLDIQKSITNILGSLSVDTIWKSPGGRVVDAALAEARATIFARAVGPLESLPVSDYIQDSIRAKNVISHTQLGPEHRLIAKLTQMNGYTNDEGRVFKNSRTPQSHPGDDPASYVKVDDRGFITDLNVPELGTATPDELSAAKANADLYHGKTLSIIDDKGKQKTFYNRWNKDTQYPDSEVFSVASETFNFRIFNIALNQGRSFPAYIETFNESDNATWSNISLINRSEDIYIYGRAERGFNLEFTIFASTADELPDPGETGEFPAVVTISKGSEVQEVGVMNKEMMWDRMNFLHTLTRPLYGENGRYAQSPYCKLYLAGMFNGIHAIIDNINFSYEPLIWDYNVDSQGGQVRPMIVKVSMAGKFLHNKTPSVKSNFYGDA